MSTAEASRGSRFTDGRIHVPPRLLINACDGQSHHWKYSLIQNSLQAAVLQALFRCRVLRKGAEVLHRQSQGNDICRCNKKGIWKFRKVARFVIVKRKEIGWAEGWIEKWMEGFGARTGHSNTLKCVNRYLTISLNPISLSATSLPWFSA